MSATTSLIARFSCWFLGHDYRSMWRTSVDVDDGGDRLDICQRCKHRNLYIKNIHEVI